MKRMHFALGAGTAGTVAIFPRGARAETLLRVSFPTPETQPTVAECVRFTRLAEQKSGGSLRFENFFSGTLAKETEVVTGLQNGVVDLTLINASFLEPQFPRSQVLSLPFLFSTRNAMWRVLGGDLGHLLESDLAEKGVMAVAWGAYGSRELELRDKRVVKPEDMRGLRIRIINSSVYVSMMKALGAIPVALDATEEFVALQQHTIDGLDITIPTLLSEKLDQVVKFVALTDHNPNAAPFLMSKRRYDALAPDQQRAITAAAREFTPGWHQTIDASDAASLQEFARRGGTINQVDKPAFRKAMDPVYDEFRKKLGAGYIDRVVKAAG